MREQDLKKYKQEVETTLAGIKSHRKPDPNFDLQKYIGTHFTVTGLSMPQLRAAFKHGYSFSHLPLDEQYQIYKYIYFNSEIFDVLLQALFFNEIYVRQAEPEFIFNELIEWIDRIDNWAHSDVGWCLRETGLVYPEKTLAFLNQYHHLITSTAFAAASEKLPVKEKEKLKALRKKSRKK
ncbi:MAG: DNA alkylation repair protein [Bacteroidetes bacterium]|nr:DNA alkylation repair protein [Bacteroidota bacterium]